MFKLLPDVYIAIMKMMKFLFSVILKRIKADFVIVQQVNMTAYCNLKFKFEKGNINFSSLKS